MGIYDNETTSQIHPDLNPTAPQEPQAYRLTNLTETESYLLDEIEVCEKIAKKWNDSIQSQPSWTQARLYQQWTMDEF